MGANWFILYSFVAFGSLLLSAALCAAARSVGGYWGLLDQPAGRKTHARPIALTGGWGIFVTFMLVVITGALFAPLLAEALPAKFAPLGHYMKNIAGVRHE